jgi:hypothetical protein
VFLADELSKASPTGEISSHFLIRIKVYIQSHSYYWDGENERQMLEVELSDADSNPVQGCW